MLSRIRVSSFTTPRIVSRRWLSTSLKLSDSSLLRMKGFINGEWVAAADKQQFSVQNPSTLENIVSVPSMGREETLSAIDSAHEAFSTWKHTTPKERSMLLKKLYEKMVQNSNDMASIMTAECGKPFREAKGEVQYAASFIEFYAHECLRNEGFMIPPSARGERLMATKQPVGVAGVVTPWNFPLAMIARKIGPALAAGCTVVIKPAEDTPLSALAITRLAEEAGFPKGVINTVTAPRDLAGDVGKTMAASKKVRKLSFTGSTNVGKILMGQCAESIKKLSLELGGNAPFIVFEDSDLDEAVRGAMASKFRNNGQTCVCSNRFYIQESIMEEFTTRLLSAIEKLNIGDGMDPSVHLGPLINSKAKEKVSSLVRDALDKGAVVHSTTSNDNRRFGPESNFINPTVLSGITSSMDISSQEIFGPVVALYPFRTEEDVVNMANDTDFGLAGYFFSRDIGRVWRVSEALECGIVGVNTGIISHVQAPFGGIKESGLGREGSVVGMDEYMEIKYIAMGGLSKSK